MEWQDNAPQVDMAQGTNERTGRAGLVWWMALSLGSG